MVFQSLWEANDDHLPIALHHGSLDVSQRRKVEAAMAEGRLRAVVCTSTLELGIDWGDVDLVIHVGAPKGSSRLLQRIHKCSLVVRLQKISLQTCLCGPFFQHGIDILQGRMTVDFRFTRPQQIQVWSMKH